MFHLHKWVRVHTDMEIAEPKINSLTSGKYLDQNIHASNQVQKWLQKDPVSVLNLTP